MTEKDAERFESVGVTKIDDARTPAAEERNCVRLSAKNISKRAAHT